MVNTKNVKIDYFWNKKLYSMALKTFVKVGNITNLSDARYCAGMGVDQIGFNIDPANSSYTEQDDLDSIRAWVSGVEIIAEGQLPDDPESYDGVQHWT